MWKFSIFFSLCFSSSNSDDYSVVATSRLKRQVRQLHAEERELREAIVEDSLRAAEIANNPEAVERYGRENYYMKRSNEDIFVVK